MNIKNTLLGLILIVLIIIAVILLKRPISAVAPVTTNTQSSLEVKQAPAPAAKEVVKTTPTQPAQQPVTPTPKTDTSNQQITSVTKDGWTAFTANGISVTAPVGYKADTQVAAAAGTNAVALNITYGNQIVISIYQFKDQSLYADSAPRQGNESTLVNGNYQISGTTGQYYSTSTGVDLISVPSKLAVITIDPPTKDVTPTVINQIVDSVKLQ